jgi:hypothetical protein
LLSQRTRAFSDPYFTDKGEALNSAHVSVAIAAGLALAVFAVPAAEAIGRTPQAHRPATKGPHDELHATSVALARATVELDGIRSQVGRGGLRGRVSRVQQILKTANAQLHSAQAELDAQSPLQVAYTQISHEYAYVKGDMTKDSRGQLISEAAMDYVAGHVSDTAYGYIAAFVGKKAVPPPTPNSALGTQAGICTGAAVTFGTIVHHFGFSVRSVNFHYDDPAPENTPDGHVAVEVRYEGGWHFFDPTYGLFWTDANGHVLPVSSVRAGLGSLQKNVADFTNLFEDSVYGNGAWFITAPTTTIKYDATQVVHRVP